MAWKPESGAFCPPPGFTPSLPHCSPHFSINFSSPQTHPQFYSRPTSCISNFWSCLFFSCDFPLQWARRSFSETPSFFLFFFPRVATAPSKLWRSLTFLIIRRGTATGAGMKLSPGDWRRDLPAAGGRCLLYRPHCIMDVVWGLIAATFPASPALARLTLDGCV